MDLTTDYANAFAQDKLELSEILNFYDNLENSDEAFNALKQIAYLLMQSSPSGNSITDGIAALPIKQTSTAAIILKTNTLNNALPKILNLPVNERRKSFIVMLLVFKKSDTWRRENICRNNCSHEWHNNDFRIPPQSSALVSV